jgi:alkylhydroperoxidase/carboxymuconolactone decarboxylase family protein
MDLIVLRNKITAGIESLNLRSNQILNLIKMETYYDPKDLKNFGKIGEFGQELADKFFDYYGNVFKDSALSAREKSLIALAVAHAVQCPYCIDAYTSDTLEKGYTEDQLMEAVHVTTAIRGGASLVHSVQMMKQAKKLMM